MSAATRKVIEMLPDIEKFLSMRERNVLTKAKARAKAEGIAEGKAEGIAEGKAQAEAEARAKTLLLILEHRRIALEAAQRERILACTDLETLERWLDRSLTASDAAEFFEH